MTLVTDIEFTKYIFKSYYSFIHCYNRNHIHCYDKSHMTDFQGGDKRRIYFVQ